MSKDPAFLFYPGDYLRDTQCLSDPAQVSYDRIMCEHMRNICISKSCLDFFTKKLNDDQKSELMQVLSLCDGGYCIDWVRESILKRRAYSVSRSKNRKKTHVNHMKSYDDHMENEIVRANRDTSIPDVFNTTTLKRAQAFNFEDVYSKYPSKIGKKAALAHFKASIKNEKDMDDIHTALNNYLKSERVKRGIIQNAATWFNNWRDWIDYEDPVSPIDEKQEILRKAGLLDDTDSHSGSERSYRQE